MDTKLCAICNQPATCELEGRALCAACEGRVIDYEDRLQSRLTHLQTAAAREQQNYQSTHEHASKMADVIPFGQPILIGHHSEGRDTRYRNRIRSTFSRAFAHLERAQQLEQRARAAEKNTAISNDDPLAVPKLQEKIAAAKASQERAKLINSTIRKTAKKTQAEQLAALQALEMSEKTAQRMLDGDFFGHKGIAPYELTSISSNIRRMEERVKELQAKQARAAGPEAVTSEMHGDICLVRNAEINRLQLVFPGKPSAETIKLLKSNGFVWSGANRAWQRQLNNGAEWGAECVLKAVGVYAPPATREVKSVGIIDCNHQTSTGETSVVDKQEAPEPRRKITIIELDAAVDMTGQEDILAKMQAVAADA